MLIEKPCARLKTVVRNIIQNSTHWYKIAS